VAEAGPIGSFFGILRADGCLPGCFNGTDCVCPGGAMPTPETEDGLPVWYTQGGERGLIVIEARRGNSNVNPGTFFPVRSFTFDPPPERPSLQLQADSPLGVPPKVGSLDVCDTGLPPPSGIGGGIPAVDPMDFGPSQFVTNALNDYACRFTTAISSQDACSKNVNGVFAFLGSGTRVQYCYNTDQIAAFQPGETTTLSVQVLDLNGNAGPIKRIKVRSDALP
jgi:hypothetical protein